MGSQLPTVIEDISKSPRSKMHGVLPSYLELMLHTRCPAMRIVLGQFDAWEPDLKRRTLFLYLPPYQTRPSPSQFTVVGVVVRPENTICCDLASVGSIKALLPSSATLPFTSHNLSPNKLSILHHFRRFESSRS